MASQISTDKKVFTFTWMIENFEYCEQQTGDFLRSPTFIVDAIDRSKWSLLVFPRGEKTGKWISLFLFRELDCRASRILLMDYELAFLAVDASVLISHTGHKHMFRTSDRGGLNKFEQRRTIFINRAKFLPHGTLTIRCQMWLRNGEFLTDEHYIARTLIGVEKKAFLWKIPNFSSFSPDREVTYRLTSTLKSSDDPIASLTLYYADDPDCIGAPYKIEIENLSCGMVFGIFRTSIIDAEGNPVSEVSEEILQSPILTQVAALPLSREALMDNPDLYLPKDTLTLYCEVSFSPGVAFEGVEGSIRDCSPSFVRNHLISDYMKTDDIKNSASNLQRDLGSMFQDTALCDVRLCVGPETFRAHSFILSARSPVFRAMLQTDMRERKYGQVVIEDLSPETVHRMLHFVYTDFMGELDWNTAISLYCAAQKYQIASLKEKCSSFLVSNLSRSNACTVLLLSDMHQDEQLKSDVQGFIVRNDKTVIDSRDWELLMKENMKLAAETMLLKFKR